MFEKLNLPSCRSDWHYVGGSRMMHDNIMSSDSCTNHPLQAFHPTKRYHKSQSTPSTCWTIILQVSVLCGRLHVLLTSESDHSSKAEVLPRLYMHTNSWVTGIPTMSSEL